MKRTIAQRVEASARELGRASTLAVARHARGRQASRGELAYTLRCLACLGAQKLPKVRYDYETFEWVWL